ncbi:helix-turn-helix transcriptional regulator [Micromonospora sp. RTGN7]|uniref:helix-turn-helix domain-containing protein n=1 Tax=Micromonospora sp. RTGN7 TaxID=3016526 RepID=UPI0029FF0856|nr:helix-turn-helix transcriptional regulator [Micromonospora sp. RTGN7]
MGDGRELRESWSEYLRRMTDRPGWSVAKLARESKIHRATIFKWISGKGGANMASVQAIAEALGDDTGNALRAASNSGAIEEDFDEDLRTIIRRLKTPGISDAERTAIRGTLKYLADLADQAERGEGRAAS